MASLTLQLKSNENKFRYDFTNAFYEKEYEVAVTKIHGNVKILFNFEFIKYDKKDDQLTPQYYKLGISNGFEDFDDIVEEIKAELPHGSKGAFKFELQNGYVVITITKPEFEMDFTSPLSIGKIFGFEQVMLKHGEYVAKDVFHVPNKTIFMTCNVLESSYFNNQRRNILYSFTANKHDYVYLANTPIYLKTLGKLKDFYITLVGIDNNKIDFDECDLLVNLHLKPIS